MKIVKIIISTVLSMLLIACTKQENQIIKDISNLEPVSSEESEQIIKTFNSKYEKENINFLKLNINSIVSEKDLHTEETQILTSRSVGIFESDYKNKRKHVEVNHEIIIDEKSENMKTEYYEEETGTGYNRYIHFDDQEKYWEKHTVDDEFNILKPDMKIFIESVKDVRKTKNNYVILLNLSDFIKNNRVINIDENWFGDILNNDLILTLDSNYNICGIYSNFEIENSNSEEMGEKIENLNSEVKHEIIMKIEINSENGINIPNEIRKNANINERPVN